MLVIPIKQTTMEKKNIGAKLALYSTPAVVVRTVDDNGKANFLLVAHVGIVSHNKLLASMHNAHFSNHIIKETGKLSLNIITPDFLAQADYTGTVSGAQVDKSHVFDYHLGENGTPLIEASPLTMECEVVDRYDIDGFENFICSVKNTYVAEDRLDEKDKPDIRVCVLYSWRCLLISILPLARCSVTVSSSARHGTRSRKRKQTLRDNTHCSGLASVRKSYGQRKAKKD